MSLRWKVFWSLFVGCMFCGTIAVCVGLAYVLPLSTDLPNVKRFIESPSSQTSEILDRNGALIGCVADEWRHSLPVEKIISTRAAQIIVAKEDHRYWQRKSLFWGLTFILDPHSLISAVLANYSSGRVVKGGSSIVQQLAKQMLPQEEQKQRTFKRKIRELLVAIELVTKLNKQEILALYLNEICFGDNRYGLQAAAEHYFSKNADNLSVRESALLAGMIKAPAFVAPLKYPQHAKIQLNNALRSALKAGAISPEEFEKAYMNPDGDEQLPLNDAYDKSCRAFPFAARSALDQMQALGFYFDNRQMTLSWTGFRIYISIDSEAQKYAEEAVKKALADYHARLGDKAIDANGAMVVIENKTGKIIAVVGGADYGKNKFNVAMSGIRQAGSAFKPIIYASYFESLVAKRIAPDTLLDQPISSGGKIKLAGNAVPQKTHGEKHLVTSQNTEQCGILLTHSRKK